MADPLLDGPASSRMTSPTRLNGSTRRTHAAAGFADGFDVRRAGAHSCRLGRVIGETFPQSQFDNLLGDVRFGVSDDWIKIRIGRLDTGRPVAVPNPAYGRFALLMPCRLQWSGRWPNDLGNPYLPIERTQRQIGWIGRGCIDESSLGFPVSKRKINQNLGSRSWAYLAVRVRAKSLI